jgi:hypothetical protein
LHSTKLVPLKTYSSVQNCSLVFITCDICLKIIFVTYFEIEEVVIGTKKEIWTWIQKLIKKYEKYTWIV